jgi:integrase/recombinase XerC
MIERFLHFLQYEKRYSQHTVISYKTDLEQFFTYLKLNFDIENTIDISPEMVRSWFVSLLDNNITARSVNRKKTALKTFFKFQQKNGVIKFNPIAKVLSPKTSKRLPTYIEEDKLKLLLDSNLDKKDIDFTFLRDQLIIEMFYSTGMRLSELVKLKESDVDQFNLTIKVLGKRNIERMIPYSSHLKIIIEKYLNFKKVEFNAEESRSWFFITASGKKIYQKLVYRVVNNYLCSITTQKKKSPHVLRHTFATHMLDHGADLNTIKEILGHANLTATQIYTHNSIEKLKLLYKQAHPKA